ncbi:MAG: 5-bromo-4-chloroindolyl phosphate hydrolysis family protein [Defluviitaleaceae bacterium]|nr:5-bromo-4-chloroindolyl phosphate hydrolysis family protein [Defluviitaleaceae bacterium]
MSGITILTLLSLAASGLVWAITKDRRNNDILNSELIKSKNPDAEVILEALEQINNLQAITNNIQSENIIHSANYIIKASTDILRKATKQPEHIPTLRPFLGYYLPKTEKMLENYSHMEKQEVKGANIVTAMNKTEKALAMLNNAFQKQLDSLFSHTANELEIDLEVLENILEQDGLK